MALIKFQKDDRVVVISECNSKGQLGTVIGKCRYPDWYEAKYISVKLDNGEHQNYNSRSLKKLNSIDEEESLKMKGDFRIAIVNLLEDYNKKDYGFALFDESVVGDLVVVNPRNTNVLGSIKEILTKEEYGKDVSKEVIGVVNMITYNERLKERERLTQIVKEKKELQRQLDAKISKLKDIEYYEKMSQELKDKDPEIADMAQKLRNLSNEL